MKKKSLIYLFLILIAPLFSSAQEQTVDSMKLELKRVTSDTAKANILLALAELISEDNVWQKYNAQALALAERNIPQSKGLELKTFLKVKANALNNIGYDKKTHGDLTSALYNYYESLKIEQQINNDFDIPTLLNNIADIYETQGNISRALEYYDQSLKLHEKTNNKRGISQAYNNIGFIYSTQGDLDKALDYYEKSFKLKKELNDRSGIAVSLSNIGYIYMLKKSEFKAMSYYLLALKTAKEIGDKERMALVSTNIAGIYRSQGNNDLALKNFLFAIKLSEEIGDKDGTSHQMSSAGTIYLLNGKTDSALYFGTRSMSYAKDIGSPELISHAAELLKNTYKATGNTAKALEYAEEYFKMHDSISSEGTRKVIYKQQVSYEYEKKESLEKVQQEIKDTEHASEIKRQKVIIWSVIIGMLIIIGFSVSLYKRFILIREQKKVIEDQKKVVDEKNKEILDSISYAKRLQEAILPPVKFVKEHLPRSFIFYNPKDIVAGDFYWMEVLDHELILFAAADCTGHGVPGAMVSVVCSNALNRTVKEFGITEPGKILDKVRELVIETFEKSESEVKDGMDISICCLNKKTNELLWAGANNPLWIISPSEDGATSLREYKPDKQAIGKIDNPKPFTTIKVEIKKNDSIYIFTDGYADQFGGPKGKKFKNARLKEHLLTIQHLPMNDQSLSIQQELESWKGNKEQVDDILIMGIRT